MAETLLAAMRYLGATIENYQPDGGEFIRGLNFDATLSEGLSGSVDWSEHPIDSGAKVTDHAVVEPPTLTLTGMLTRTPIWMTTERDNLDPAHMDTAIETLWQMRADRARCLIVTGLAAYEDYYIDNLEITRGVEDGQSVKVSMSFRKIQIVTAGTTLLPPLPVKKEMAADATATSSQGSQSATDATSAPPAPPTQEESLLYKTGDKTGFNQLLGGGA
jgi:hypothetical protein